MKTRKGPLRKTQARSTLWSISFTSLNHNSPSFLLKTVFIVYIIWTRGSLSTMCLQACQGFNRYSVLFIFRSTQERGRSRLASCGNRSGEGTHGTSIRGPDVVIPGCSLWGQFLHSQRDLKRRNPPRANTL